MACGYDRKTNKIMEELTIELGSLELYLGDGYRQITNNSHPQTKKIMDVRMNDFIRIYSY